ncbi:MAG: DJ-1/PfpI family protein [Dysgonamonadaceae bacterium]|nr:DJ-1/PfpI family protein [Dysgonamonadaceae bacterium]
MKAFVFLATGFEEIEAVSTVDILLRGGLEVTTVSVTGHAVVTGAHGVPVVAGTLFEQVDDWSSGSILVLPGGLPGSDNLNAHQALKDLLLAYHEQGKWIAAICAAPRVPGSLGLLKGRKACCYPGTEPLLTGAVIQHAPVVQDGNIITGQGPGFVFDFALKLVEVLQGPAKARAVAEGMLLK